MLLRDDRQMALNEVEMRCMECADHYASAAERIDDADLARLFEQLAVERKRQARELAPHIRALGDLPKAPDRDREGAEELLSTVKSLFSGDQRTTVIDEREQAEAQLAEAVAAALQCALSPAAHDFLIDLQASIEQALKNLAAHRPA